MNDKFSNKIWHLVSLTVAPDAEELAGSILFDMGATGTITLEESPERTKLGAYFDEQRDSDNLARLIEAEFARAGILNSLFAITLEAIPEQDWMQKWKEGFEPIHIGNRLLVAPSWKVPEKREARAVIQIDPGMAFGTGTHETTRLCLEAIEKYWQGGTMIDVGTGTGILAIGAALLVPTSRITAIDIDPLAVEVAGENIAINKVEKNIDARVGEPAEFAGQTFDVVVANLTAEVIIALMGDLAACLQDAGVMILSGILTTLREDVQRSAAQFNLKIIECQEAGEWSMLVARRGDI
ncbi:MAG: 50S ribosomal protein L11 methyltransferase [Acidobacteriota bacterium]